MIDSLFGSKTRVKLLYLFLNNLEKSFYVREITRMIDEQINSVRRELANMVSVGIVKQDAIDNKLYYSVNEDYPYVKPLMVIFSDKNNDDKKPASVSWEDSIKRIRGLKIAITAGKLDIGSIASVDLLLVGDNMSAVAIKNLIKRIEKAKKSEINYAIMTYDDFYYRMSVKDRFIMDMIRNKHSVLLDTEGIMRKE
ncbi:transcriptional regulator [Candidatus Nanosynbacter sp. TM7-074]|uniref:Transcriptional regulator n=1 Tax=Candidatus Nanosynbacter sp. TM7-074 TaxID=3158573 RepID=A0AB39J9T4_9BACT